MKIIKKLKWILLTFSLTLITCLSFGKVKAAEMKAYTSQSVGFLEKKYQIVEKISDHEIAFINNSSLDIYDTNLKSFISKNDIEIKIQPNCYKGAYIDGFIYYFSSSSGTDTPYLNKLNITTLENSTYSLTTSSSNYPSLYNFNNELILFTRKSSGIEIQSIEKTSGISTTIYSNANISGMYKSPALNSEGEFIFLTANKELWSINFINNILSVKTSLLSINNTSNGGTLDILGDYLFAPIDLTYSIYATNIKTFEQSIFANLGIGNYPYKTIAMENEVYFIPCDSNHSIQCVTLNTFYMNGNSKITTANNRILSKEDIIGSFTFSNMQNNDMTYTIEANEYYNNYTKNGEYPATVTVSDGIASESFDITICVADSVEADDVASSNVFANMKTNELIGTLSGVLVFIAISILAIKIFKKIF